MIRMPFLIITENEKEIRLEINFAGNKIKKKTNVHLISAKTETQHGKADSYQ